MRVAALLFITMSIVASFPEICAATEPPARIDSRPRLQGERLESEKGPFLMGPVDRAQWLEFAPDLKTEYAAYAPAPELVEALSAYEGDVTVLCVLGTWCSDSRRELPRFWKLLDEVESPYLALEMIGVGRKNDPAAAAWREAHDIAPAYRELHDVTYVPTFIFLEHGEEVGRIIETPAESLEQDAVRILGLDTANPDWH